MGKVLYLETWRPLKANPRTVIRVRLLSKEFLDSLAKLPPGSQIIGAHFKDPRKNPRGD